MTWIGSIAVALAGGAGFAATLWGIGAVLSLFHRDDDTNREWP